MSLTRSSVVAFAVMLPVAIVAAITGGTVGWVVLAAGGVALGLGLGVVSRRQRTT
jgi:hypothetical protein